MFKTLLRVVISLFFIGLLFYSMRGDMPGVLQSLRDVKPLYAVLALASYLGAVVCLSIRLQVIFRVQGTPITLAQSTQVTFIGFFFNTFLPTSIGGDLVKAYCGSKLTRERLKAFISVFVDRLFGLFMFILIPSCTILFLMDDLDPRVPWTVFGAFAVSCAAILLIWKRGWMRMFSFLSPLLKKIGLKDKLVIIYDGMHHFKYHKRAVAKVMLASIAAQTFGTLSVYFLVRSLSAEINLLYVFWLTPVVLLISMLPSIGGLGVRENAFKVFFRPFVGVHEAVALGFLYLLMLFVMSFFGGIVYLVRHEYHFGWKEFSAAEPPQILKEKT